MFKKHTIKRVGSLFFLGIFLWFYSVKDIHDIIHADDVHHHYPFAENFQTPEHHCLICDFVFPCFDDQSPNFQIPFDNSSFKVQNFYTVQAILGEPVSLFSSRAPPAVA